MTLKYLSDKMMEEIIDEYDLDQLNKMIESIYPDDTIKQVKGKIDILFLIKGERIIKNIKERTSWATTI